MTRLMGWLCIIGIAISIAIILHGCADLPPCNKPDALIVNSPQGMFVIFTAENLVKLQERFEAIRDGKCDPNKDPEAL